MSTKVKVKCEFSTTGCCCFGNNAKKKYFSTAAKIHIIRHKMPLTPNTTS